MPGNAPVGTAAIHDLTEDGATAEISRSQLWRWIAQRVVTEQGDLVTRGLLNAVAEREAISA